MMKRIRKTQHKCRQAFTLVELIVVLVVLAILAGILVPALTGYIKQGKKVKYIQEVDAYRTAAQAVMAEWYGHNGERIDYRDIFWDKNDDNGKWGEKVLNLMGYSRGEKNGEPYILVIGDREAAENTVSINVRGSNKQIQNVPLDELVKMCCTMNSEHSLELIDTYET